MKHIIDIIYKLNFSGGFEPPYIRHCSTHGIFSADSSRSLQRKKLVSYKRKIIKITNECGRRCFKRIYIIFFLNFKQFLGTNKYYTIYIYIFFLLISRYGLDLYKIKALYILYIIHTHTLYFMYY